MTYLGSDELTRRLQACCLRVDELRDQVQKQINLRVAAEQRAGNRNVKRLESENAQLRHQALKDWAEIERLKRQLGIPWATNPL
jgi:predicted nuclease with TOPRIM domain